MADLFNQARHGSITQHYAELALDNLESQLRRRRNNDRMNRYNETKRQMKKAAMQVKELAAKLEEEKRNEFEKAAEEPAANPAGGD